MFAKSLPEDAGALAGLQPRCAGMMEEWKGRGEFERKEGKRDYHLELAVMKLSQKWQPKGQTRWKIRVSHE